MCKNDWRGRIKIACRKPKTIGEDGEGRQNAKAIGPREDNEVGDGGDHKQRQRGEGESQQWRPRAGTTVAAAHNSEVSG
ncbi:hypothetical protein SESBI_40118 [Sesbania bispinosa]|nr:hypothetical protein SESBI_40118 [Sesbania bispinosa]